MCKPIGKTHVIYHYIISVFDGRRCLSTSTKRNHDEKALDGRRSGLRLARRLQYCLCSNLMTGLQAAEAQSSYFDWGGETELRRRQTRLEASVPEKNEKKVVRFCAFQSVFSANFASFLRHFLVFHPLILLVQYAVPTESIGAVNAAPASSLSTTWVGPENMSEIF